MTSLVVIYMINYMHQFNINIGPEFERDLKTYMKLKGFKHKAEAIRRALHEAVVSLTAGAAKEDFRSWLGYGLKVLPRDNPRFKHEDELWS